MDTPVALSVFARPDFTERVFDEIRRAKPRELFVFADGPRSPDDVEACAKARDVATRVDWECDLRTDFSSQNLGARRRYASGLDWVFSQVDSALIFDDDCVPDPTFFPFCEAMLARYRDDTRVMMVIGTNLLGRWKADRQSCHFSYFGCPWGWASWRRAWAHYDITMSRWGDPENRELVRNVIGDDVCYAMQARRFERLYNDPDDRHSWDLPWSLACLLQSGLTVTPAVNLVSNIGCVGNGAMPPEHPFANLPRTSLSFPIRFPAFVGPDRAFDRELMLRLHDERIFGPLARYVPEAARLLQGERGATRRHPSALRHALRRFTPSILLDVHRRLRAARRSTLG